jgi:exodeoxyribonuclease V alpha subunit
MNNTNCDVTSNLIIPLPYHRFIDVQKQLVNIEAIDYFFAKQFTKILILSKTSRLIKTDITENQSANIQHSHVLFHLLIALSVSLRDGHSCLPLSTISSQRFGYSCDKSGIVTHQGFHFPNFEQLSKLMTDLNIDATESGTQEQGIVFHNEKLYLRRYYIFEQQVVNFIQQHQQSRTDEEREEAVQCSHSMQVAKINHCLEILFPQQESNFSKEIDWQKVAVANALNKSFSIIAGGPGTGKTYTVTKLLAAIIMLNDRQTLNISLVAPTGKAAQRLSESISNAKAGFKTLISHEVLEKIPSDTKTIHRLLGVIPNSPNFRHHQDNRLNIDVLLIDEVSMVDLPLMARIFRALPEHCQVILLGDAQQLPSVAAGSILSDLTPFQQAQYSANNRRFLQKVTSILNLPVSKSNPVDHLTFLTKSRRFDGKGGIGLLSQLVIAGESEQGWQLLQEAKENKVPQLIFVEQADFTSNKGNWFTDLVEQYYRPLIHANSIEDAFSLLAKFRFLSATRQGETGVNAINQLIESILVPHMFSSAYSNNGTYRSSHYINHKNNNTLYHTKPIMINENDYSLGLYNGDIGLIWKNEQGHLMAVFELQDGGYKHILPSRLPQYETVYAMTIHKTQGSEFQHIALILPSNTDNQLLTRELLYTGITRAKAQITLQSKKSVWFQGVESKVSRHSGIQLDSNKV